MKTGGMFTQQMDDHGKRVEITGILVGPIPAPVVLIDAAGSDILNQRGSFRQGSAVNTFVAVLKADQAPVPWKSLAAIFLWINPQGDDEQKISFEFVKVTATDVDGGTEVLVDQSYGGGHLIITDEGAHIAFPVKRPPPPPAPLSRPGDEIEDEILGSRLITHLQEHAPVYTRAIAMAQNPIERAAALDAIKLPGGATVLEKVENRPLEMVGDYTAYPCTDGLWSSFIRERLGDSADDTGVMDERLVALPTRGLFAEAKLGHCNASEVIDNTRFWDWQQSPIPHMAPEIAPVTPVSPQPQQQNLSPTQFPSSIVNIVNPPNAPDPAGMAAAMSLLATPGIFRDMSGRAEVADVLKNLADNAVKVAGIAAGGRGMSGSGSSSIASPHGERGSSGAGVIGGPRAGPNQPSATSRDLQDFQNVLGRAQSDGLITPEAARQAFGQAIDAATGGMELQQVGDTYVRPAYTPSELAAIIGERIAAEALNAQNHIVFTDWRKHVSATGFDMVSFDRATGELWIIDNKAQFRGIGGANALTGAKFPAYEEELRKFLNYWPVKAEADLAIQALNAKKYKLVVSNGFAGETARFTKGLFEKGLHAFDVRLGKLFSNHAEWEVAYKALTLRKGIRLTSMRGAALMEANLLAAAVAIGAGMFMLSSGVQLKQVGAQLVAQFAVDSVLSRLPGGLFAAFVIGMESDESPSQREARLLNEQIDAVMEKIPGIETLSAAEKKSSRDAVKQMLQNPIIIEDPSAQPPGFKLPGFRNPKDLPSPTDA
jgi:hypothetical protein